MESKLSKSLLLALLSLVSISLPASGQGPWISFIDDTDARLSLTSVPLGDGEEKDVAVADLDKDGWTDAVIVRKEEFSNPGGRSDLLLMNEGGVLVERTAELAPEFLTDLSDARDVFIGDFDGDTWEDVVIANTFGQQPLYYANLGEDVNGDWLGLKNQSASRFPALVQLLQFCALWAGDITGNGALDLYFSNYAEFGTSFDVLLVNDGSGNFTDETVARLGNLRNSAFGTSVEIFDVDDDGDNDIIKTSTLNTIQPWNDIGNFLLFNDGTGNFSNWQKIPGGNPYMFTVGDLDDNGIEDIYVVDDFQDYVDRAIAVLQDTGVQYNQETLTNSPRTTGFGGNVKMADFDLDGDLDVAIADVDVDIPSCTTTGDRRFTLLRNQGLHSGTLVDPWGTNDNPWNVSAFDFGLLDIDGDGLLDILMAGCQGYSVFMRAEADLTVAVTPHDDPVVVDAAGGSFQYDLEIVNTTGSPQSVDIWVQVSGPGNLTFGPVSRTHPQRRHARHHHHARRAGRCAGGHLHAVGQRRQLSVGDSLRQLRFREARRQRPFARRELELEPGSLIADSGR